MRRLGVAVVVLLCSQLPSWAQAQPEGDEIDPGLEELDSEGELEGESKGDSEGESDGEGEGNGDGNGDGETGRGQAGGEPPAKGSDPCGTRPDTSMLTSTSRRVIGPDVVLTLAVAESSSTPACIWTDDPWRPSYSVSTEPCGEDKPTCHTVELESLSVGDHSIVIEIGDVVQPYDLVVLASDCSLRPTPSVLASSGSDDADDDSDDDTAAQGPMFQAGAGAFKLTLPEPIELGPEPTACWWFEPPGLDEQITQQWPVRPCDGQDPLATTCVMVEAPSWIAPGLYAGAVAVGTADPQPATLWVPPRLLWLWVATLSGFVLWVLVNVYLKGVVTLSTLERRRDQLRRRLESSHDDHKLLLARVWAVLDFADSGLRGNKLVLAFSDLAPLEKHLLEAEQLLTLSEKKMRIWDRVDTQLQPPTLVAQVVTELKLFDDVVLQRNFPMPVDPSADEGGYSNSDDDPLWKEFPSLQRAHDLMQAAQFQLDANLIASCSLALGTDASDHEDPSGDEDLGDEPTDDEPADASSDDEPTHATPNDATSIIDTVRAAGEREREQLQRLKPYLEEQSGNGITPSIRLEADLRLDVLRKIERLLARPELHPHLDPVRLKRALHEWGRADLQDSFSQQDHRRLHRDVIRWLVWRPENHRFEARLQTLRIAQKKYLANGKQGRAPLTVRTLNAEPWRTYSPRMLVLALDDDFRDLAQSHLWRRRIKVQWQTTEEKKKSDLVLVTTEVGFDQGSHVAQHGPHTVGFARTEGKHRLEPVVTFSDDTGRGAELSIPVAPLTIEVGVGARQVQLERIQLYNGARTTISLVGSIAAAVLLFDDWQRDPPAYVYWQALLFPIGIDITTGSVDLVRKRINRLLPGGHSHSEQSDEDPYL